MTHSHLVKMRIANFGCIGSEGLDIELDEIVCLVGPNNTGKSTVLKAYEYAVGNKRLGEEEFCYFSDQQPTVEIWVHIPEGVQNIDEKWKEPLGNLLIVRSKWQWDDINQSPTRTTWNPDIQEYDPELKAAGLDTVFSSRLPKPLRIGALDGPEEENNELLKLVLEPIEQELKNMVEDGDSSLNISIKNVKEEIQSPIAGFVKKINEITGEVNRSYQKTFPNYKVDLKIDVSDIDIKPMALLQKGSSVGILEDEGRTTWKQQGTGSQRALFWSLLEIRTKLFQTIDKNKQKESRLNAIPVEIQKLEDEIGGLSRENAIATRRDKIKALKEELQNLAEENGEPQFLPSYMLLIDEPEVALHPNAIRGAREHLYELAQDVGWQVMLTTHSPAFVDPLEDHTTIVRLTRESNRPTPKTYRSDEVIFTGDGKENLKMLLQFDNSLAEAFFGSYPIIIEGDTEYAAFQKVMEIYVTDYPVEKRPVLVRARGKYTIILIAKIFMHFKIPFSVLHDSDAPFVISGRKSSAWTANERIITMLNEARRSGLRVVHRVSIPDFERGHGLEEVEKDKPYNFRKQIADAVSIQESVKNVLDELITDDITECVFGKSNDALEDVVKNWAKENASGDPRFVFEAKE